MGFPQPSPSSGSSGVPAYAVMGWGGELALNVAPAAGSIANVNRAHGWRVLAPKTGTLSSLYLLVATASGNIEVAIVDAVSGANRTRLWTTGSIACPAQGWQLLGNPGLSVTVGQAFDFTLNADNTSALFGRFTAFSSATYGALPLPANLASNATVPTKNYPAWQRATTQFPMGSTFADSDLNGYVFTYSIIGYVT